MGLAGDPANLEGKHGYLFMKVLQTGTSQVVKVLLENSLQGPVVRIHTEEGKAATLFTFFYNLMKFCIGY